MWTTPRKLHLKQGLVQTIDLNCSNRRILVLKIKGAYVNLKRMIVPVILPIKLANPIKDTRNDPASLA